MSELPFKVKAIYSYTSPHEDDLNFPSGQIITVTEEEDSDWYYGEYVDETGLTKEGIFPRNFVERAEPDAPPRPTRSHRSRKSAGADASAIQEPSKLDRSQDERPSLEGTSEQAGGSVPGGQLSQPASIDREHRSESPPSHRQPPSIARVDSQPKAESGSLPPPTPSVQSKPVPSSHVDNPVASSFRDRIAAFNKPAAPPITPFKPAGLGQGGSSFVKKPYVPPPPSRDAYVPPPRETSQKRYQREEDVEAEATPSQEVRTAEVSTQDQEAGSEQKPTSLKERIALLQKQQLENAVRQSEAGRRREAEKRPPKQRIGSFEDREDHDSRSGLEKAGAPSGAKIDDNDTSSADALNESVTGNTVQSTVSHSTPNTGAHDFPSDANDADQSGFDEVAEDAEGSSTEQDDNDRTPAGVAPARSVMPPAPSDIEAGEEKSRNEDGEEEQEEEDVDIDPEIKRRMEIRERVAKMSGGMGMHGMFGIPGGIPPIPHGGGVKRDKAGGTSGEKEKTEGKHVEREDRGRPVSQGQPISVLPPLPRRQSFGVREGASASPIENDAKPGADISRETLAHAVTVQAEKTEAGMGSPPQTEPSEQLAPTTPDRRLPQAADTTDADDYSPQLHPSTSLPSDAAAVVDPPRVLSPSAGSESDDEMSLHSRIPEPTTKSIIPPGNLDAHQLVPPQPLSAGFTDPSIKQAAPNSPINTNAEDERKSQAPNAGGWNSDTLPIRERPPPPPPPTDPARTRITAGDAKPSKPPKATDLNPTEDEVTEYDGDYDTDIASSATHKAALSASTQEQGDDSSNVFGSIAASATNTTRTRMAPPIPRLPAPRARRQSTSKDTDQTNTTSADMPRGAPPPIPTAPRSNSGFDLGDGDDYDPYRYTSPVEDTSDRRISYFARRSSPLSNQPGNEENLPEEEMTLPPRPSQEVTAVPPTPPKVQSFRMNPPQNLSQSMATSPRQSQEVARSQSSVRKSMDQSRVSAEQGHVARDVDLGRSSLWWGQPNQPPPAFQNRNDLIYEVEESRTSKRGGRTMIARDVYALFHDYSQTIVTARFDPGAIEDVSLEQRHEPPPPRLRQDQLEELQVRFGRRLAEEAKSKQNAVVGDGSPQSLITELLKPLSGALMPIGSRAYGAMVYLNLANASIQQQDEIRPGDVISFRNARFQGHKGAMHQKYNMDVGKPDHVGIVMDWDGTKKKVRAWEQGREGKKVKLESFKLGDLRSGEVKVWRVAARSWVGWESQS